MNILIKLQEIMLKNNLVIRALPKEIEYKLIYNSGRKEEYDNILKKNSSARLETNENDVQYIVYKEQTKYQKDSFIVSIKKSKGASIDSWEWLVDERKKFIIFNSLEEIIKYFQN